MSEMDIYCRTCTCQVVGNADFDLESYNIFEIEGLADKLMQCTSSKIELYDDYPPVVCEICFAKISDFFEFQQMCRNSLEHFKDLLEQKTPQVKSEHALEEFTLCDDIVKCTTGKDEMMENQLDVKIEYDFECSGHDPLLDDNNTDAIEEIVIERVVSLSQSGNVNKIRRSSSFNEEVDDDNDDTAESITCVKPGKKAKSERKVDKKSFGDKGAENESDTDQIQLDSLKEDELDDDDEMDSSSEDGESLSDNESDSSDEPSNTKVKSKTRYKCDLCPKNFRLKHCYESHMRTHQGLLNYPCNRQNCGRSYRRLCDLRQHLRDHDGLPREYRCKRPNCGLIFNRDKDLRRHLVDVHDVPPSYKCNVENCGKEFQSKSYRNKHIRVRHTNEPQKPPETHVCDTCGAILRSVNTLRKHALLHVDRSQWPIVCDVEGCSKRFRLPQTLIVHKKRHAGIKDFACPHCDMRFVTSTNLKYHINTHTRERTWSCEFCSKVCNTVDLLRRHIETKHGIVNRFPCTFCDRTFTTANAKMYHEMTHLGDDQRQESGNGDENSIRRLDPGSRAGRKKEAANPYSCDFCDRTFESLQKKKEHEMIHTGEKPHVCEQCGRAFRLLLFLKKHMIMHTKGGRGLNFPCSVCDRAFASVQSRKHHEMKHTKEKPYKCEECGFFFRWPNNLTRHRKLHLRDKMAEENTQECETEEGIIEKLEEADPMRG